MPITVGADPAPIAGAGAGGELANPYPITVPPLAGPGGQRVLQGAGRFCGWSLIETTGAATAVIELYDGMDTTGQLLAVADIVGSSPTQPQLDHEGVELRIGLFLNVISGTVRGVVWCRTGEAP